MLIDKSQSGFIKGRFILDEIAAAQELISNCYREKIGGGMLLKLDFVKAYGMLDWDILFEVLRARQFGDKW